MKLHHVGLVVPNIKDSLGELIKFLNFETITLPTLIGSQKVNVCFLQIGESYLELIEPASPDSPVINFVNKGGGFHHLCFEVKDIHKELDILKEKGAKIIVEPVKGFEDRIVAFVMLTMKNTKCNLIELAEEKKNSN
jgi:methylmalonyl-CoA/ethylmalonyl-CoA epimerase|tara:strand:- start:170 stop:580 length:411 start_codon:yes stop_codon:yes gene_type:complete